jgi:DtxR family Mn-dependent transcriptional regulator
MAGKSDLTLRVPASCRPGEQDRTKRLLSESVEEYLDGIYRLQHEFGSVPTGEIAAYMFVSPGSATAMVKRMAEMGLVDHIPYQGIRLTEYGMRIAKQLTRAHRVLKAFFVLEVGLPWSDVHELACKLEHYLDETVIDKMHEKMGRPLFCPHGSPIDPDRPDPSIRLGDAEAGDWAVYRITDERVEFLEHLEELGLKPQVRFTATGSTRIDKLIHLAIHGREATVGPEVGRHLWVVPAGYEFPTE